MHPYTTRTRAQIAPGEMARVTLTDPLAAAAAVTVLERIPAYQAEAEKTWLLKEHGLAPATGSRRRHPRLSSRCCARGSGWCSSAPASALLATRRSTDHATQRPPRARSGRPADPCGWCGPSGEMGWRRRWTTTDRPS